MQPTGNAHLDPKARRQSPQSFVFSWLELLGEISPRKSARIYLSGITSTGEKNPSIPLFQQ